MHTDIRILIAEDSPTQAAQLCGVLEMHGYHVTVARNGREALEVLRHDPPMMVITDILMPEMDGYELCRQIKTSPDWKHLPVMLLTSLSEPVEVIRSLECGADSFTIKPWEEHQILTRIQRLSANGSSSKPDAEHSGIKIHFADNKFLITSNRRQILNLLLSTYETATEKNRALVSTQDELWALNEHLEAKVQERTLALEADIIERKRAEDALRHREESYRALFDRANDGILLTNTNGELLSVNESFARMHGYSTSDILARGVQPLQTPASARLAPARMGRLLAGQALTFEVEHVHQDGHVFPLEVSASLICSGSTSFVQYMYRDISERKRVEETLLETNRQLVEANTRANCLTAMAETANLAKSEFLANMSHEIRTPMNGVIGMIGLLLDTQLDTEQRHYAETVHTSGKLMLNLINDILDFSKVEAGKLELEILDFDLPTLLKDSVAIMAVRARDKGLALHCAANPQVPTLLRGDAVRLCQILTNLVNNAIKFTHAGEVEIRVSLLEKSPGGVLLRFSVRDTGIGIPAAKLSLLFDKFSQVETSTTRRYGGTGLGLAISKQLAKLMGGDIGVTSDEGKGSEFWFSARLGTPAASHPQAIATPPVSHGMLNLLAGCRARVLVVEDNLTNQQVAMGILQRMGLQADMVANGEEALLALAGHAYDLVLMDVQMPVMDGLEATRLIRSANSAVANPQVPIIAMTAHAIEGDRQKCLEAGMNDYVSKPVSPQSLAEVLKQWLPKAVVQDVIAAADEPLPAPPPAELAVVFDRAGFAARMMHDEALLQLVSQGFLQDIPVQISVLHGLLQAGDAAAVQRHAHSIKGAFANVGAERMRELACQIEHAARAGSLPAAAAHMPGLQRQFDELKQAMTQVP